MTLHRTGRRILRISVIVLGLIAVLAIVFHFWFIHHARQLMEDTVANKSEGKLKLKIEKLSYNYFSRQMVIRDAMFFSTDTLTASSAYRISVKNIHLELKALLPLVLSKKLLIDSLHLRSPEISVTTLRFNKDTTRKNSRDLSIPYELGKVYHSIQDALKVLQVNRFHITEGKFSLINKAQPEHHPLHISNIDFQIENLQVDTSKLTGREKILFSDNVTLKSHSQDILFPDGRHRLSFGNFSINLKSKLVEFDSCTIAAVKTDSSMSAFRVFFDTLKLTNIDFDTLYRSEVIKADSVYCLNPQFDLEVESGKRKGIKKPLPKLENIVRQLTGDLMLDFVVVENAGFNITTIKEGKPTSFVFSHNNFEMQGLSVAQDAPKTIKVRSFAMAIRNYENFIKDSSYSIQFDSIRFQDDQITLSRFLFNKLDNGRIINTFSVPQFTLEGLSWDDLVFERKLRARTATMFQPHIQYTAARGKARKRQTIFQSLGVVNEYMDLEQLDIIQGTIDLRLRNDLRVQLDNTNLSVRSQSLLSSTKMAGIKNSLIGLDFDDGKIQAGNTTIELKDILYKGANGAFAAGKIQIRNKAKDLLAVLEEIAVEKMTVEENSGSISADGITWKQGEIRINSGAGNDKTLFPDQVIDLKNIKGGNTTYSGNPGGTTISTRLNSISVSTLKKLPGVPILIEGLEAEGRQLKVANSKLNLSAAGYSFRDNQSSTFSQVIYKSDNENLKASVNIPSLSLIPRLASLMGGKLAMDNVELKRPTINLDIKKTPGDTAKKGFPKLSSNKILLQNPVINFSSQSDSGVLTMNWEGKTGSDFLRLEQLESGENNLSLQNMSIDLADFRYTDPRGKSFQTGNGKLKAALRDVLVSKNETLNWKGRLSYFEASELVVDSIGLNNGKLELKSGNLRDLQLSSDITGNIQKLIAANLQFRLDRFTGNYSSNRTEARWYNAGYDRHSNSFSLDSFSYNPALPRDSFLLSKDFQTDYISAGTGSIRIGPVDLEAFIRDTVLKIGSARIEEGYFIDYKDKSLPFNPGIIKPLPASILKKIPLKLNIDSLVLRNSRVEYTEVNEKTRVPATIPITRMDVRLYDLKNHNLQNDDSLTINATGYLMDSVMIHLRIKESYTDSLGGFRMSFRMQPTDLTVFNRLLIPMASVRVISGQLDTLTMRAIGRDYLALGTMHMYYKDLKIQVLKKTSTDSVVVPNRFVSFIANSFVIRKNNDSKPGNVFFIRIRDRSPINYYLKIALSGMASSIGAKSNNKMHRRFGKELQEKGLPPAELE